MLFNSQVSFKQSASERDQGMLLLIKNHVENEILLIPY